MCTGQGHDAHALDRSTGRRSATQTMAKWCAQSMLVYDLDDVLEMSMQCVAIQLAEGSHIGSKHQHMLHCNTAACTNKLAANPGGMQAVS